MNIINFIQLLNILMQIMFLIYPPPHTMDLLSDLTRFFLALKFYMLIHVFSPLNFLFYLSLQLFTIRVRS